MDEKVKSCFSFVTIFVKDINSALNFYSSVFGMKPVYANENKLNVQFLFECTNILFVSESVLKDKNENDVIFNLLHVGLTFTTEEVEEVYQLALKEGASSISPPQEEEGALITAEIRDPNGVLIQLLCYD